MCFTLIFIFCKLYTILFHFCYSNVGIMTRLHVSSGDECIEVEMWNIHCTMASLGRYMCVFTTFINGCYGFLS